ncbi:MAG TPA: histidine kinase [Actinomycetes bacterium]|nr:histidine kinase [Actinomycetes bacterium]
MADLGDSPVERVALVVTVSATVLFEAGAIVLSRGVAPLAPAILYACYSVIQALAGALVVWAHPRHRVGWLLMLSAAFNAAVSDFGLAYYERAAHEGWVGANLALILGWSAWIVAALGLILLFLWFPDGLITNRARWVPWLWAVGAVFALPGWILNPQLGSQLVGGVNPYAIGSAAAESLFLVGVSLIAVALVASVVDFILRFRRATGILRLQLTCMAYAAALAAVILPVSAVLWTVWSPIHLFAAIALTLLPVAASVAILRYHLYDIDLVVSRTVAYATITGLLVITYAAVVVLVGARLSSPVAAAVGALVVALAFRPLRDRVQARVDRRFRRARYETRRRMADFVDAIRRGDDAVDHLEDRLRMAVEDPTCLVAFVDEHGGWLDLHGGTVSRIDGGSTYTSASPSTARLTPVVVHGKDAERAVAEALDAGRLAFEIAALQVDLRRQLDQLDASRARVVAAADEERRRIARNLHDGAQQRLVAIGLNLRHLQHQLSGSAPTVHAALDAAVNDLGQSIDELRELAGGVRPSSLDDGLRAALHDFVTRTPAPVAVNVTGDRFSPALETTAYFIAAEGLTNAVKHARAEQISLTVARQGDQLVVSVDDDGEGGADPLIGTGLRGLADRARSHGGTIEVSSQLGAGTRLEVRLPCG